MKRKSIVGFALAAALIMNEVIPSYAYAPESASIHDNLGGITNCSNAQAVECIDEYAAEEGIENLDANQVLEDIDTLDCFGIKPEALSINDTSGDTVVYDLDLGNGIVDQVQVEESPDGDVTLTFDEGELSNTLEYTTDGKLYIDGREFYIVNDTVDNAEENTFTDDKANLTPNQAREEFFRTTPYKGTASNYNKYIATQKCKNINARNDWGSITTGALASAICCALEAVWYVSIPVGILVALATDLRTDAEKHGYDEAFMSFNVKKYQYVVSGTSTQYYKYTGTYYGKAGYDGTPHSYTFYEKVMYVY